MRRRAASSGSPAVTAGVAGGGHGAAANAEATASLARSRERERESGCEGVCRCGRPGATDRAGRSDLTETGTDWWTPTSVTFI